MWCNVGFAELIFNDCLRTYYKIDGKIEKNPSIEKKYKEIEKERLLIDIDNKTARMIMIFKDKSISEFIEDLKINFINSKKITAFVEYPFSLKKKIIINLDEKSYMLATTLGTSTNEFFYKCN